jgi:hypothetical protein
MLSRAERRPARLERTPRRTRATAPAHSNPSCTGAIFLDFDSFIEHYPHEEKRDLNNRSTLHHSLGPRGTRIPPSTAVLAFATAMIRWIDLWSFIPADQIAKNQIFRSDRFATAHPARRSERSRAASARSPHGVTMSSDNSSFNFHPRHFGDSGKTTTGDRKLFSM